jgi:DNA-binding NarL/FixJ family response regulator
MIADANPHNVHALRRVVDVPEIRVVAEVDAWDDVLDTAVACHPDVILLDGAMDDSDTGFLISAIADALPAVSIVVIDSTDDEDALIEAIRAGASGFLHAGIGRDALVRAIRGTARGDVALSVGDARWLVHRLSRNPRSSGVSMRAGSRLSAREREVIRLLSEGHTARKIAEKLGLSTRTVEGHVARIREKLGARNRADAVRRYLGA